jgi:uncharacterized protein
MGLQIVLSGVVFAVFLLFGGIWAFQTYGIYQFDRTPQTPVAFGLTTTRVVTFFSEDGTSLQAWVASPAPERPVILSFYGNSSAIGPSMQRLAPLIADGYGLVMMQYRGSGGAAGWPSEEGFARDARALYDQLDALIGQPIPQGRRALHGFSLGAGVGSRLAAERPFGAVVLEASFPRACEYYQKRYLGFPLCTLMWAERFDIIDRIGSITAPKLFVHGTEDRSIPLLWGQRLFEAAPAPKVFVALPGGGHSDLVRHGLIEAMQDFLGEHIG